jgi:hypothetical protein
VLLSRFMVSRDWRPVQLRARAELGALIAVSRPRSRHCSASGSRRSTTPARSGASQAALTGVAVRVLGGPGSPCTLERCSTSCAAGSTSYISSVTAWQRRTGAPALILQDDAGEAVVIKAEDLAARIGELHRGPRLLVLASCQSAGDGEPIAASRRSAVQAALAARLADAGVPGGDRHAGLHHDADDRGDDAGVLRELLRDGQIDRALAAARGAAQGRATRGCRPCTRG